MPAEYELNLTRVKKYFWEIPVTVGAPAPLPDGSLGITDRQAVMTAAAQALGQPKGPGVFVTARFALYSSPYPAERLPSGEMKPFYQKLPVWLITYYGPGYSIPASTTNPKFGVKHVQYAIVDAQTNRLLSFFS